MIFGYDKKFFLALSVLIGTIVGAGIFGIPYVVSKSGITPGFFYLIFLAGAALLIHLFFGEIILRTKEKCRLPGLAQKYLGNKGKIFITVSVLLGTTGALLAFIILAGDFLRILFSPIFKFSSFQFSFIFWLILSFFIFRGIKIIARAELLTNLIFFTVLLFIIWFCLPQFNFSNFTPINLPNIFLPFGVILFSLIGWPAIPELTEVLKTPEEKQKIKRIIVFATTIVLLFYLLFALAVVGVSGEQTSFDALSGLVPFLGNKIIFLGVFAGVITLADSFLVLGLYLRNTLIYDFKFSKTVSSLISCGAPFLLFLAGLRSFISTVGFVGTIIGVIEGIIIILIFKKAKTLGSRQPEYSLNVPKFLLYFLMLILILGAISQFL